MRKSSCAERAAWQVYVAEAHAHVSEHPNVATLHEAYHDESHLFFVMDLHMDGSLAERIYDAEEDGQEVDEDEERKLKSIMLQLIDALEHCHENDISHRDLKPGNILISQVGGEVKAYLADFGLATSAKAGDEIAGTPPYTSPGMFDQLCLLFANRHSLEHGGIVNYAASDVWSLGITLAEMFAKNLPWGAAHHADEGFKAYMEDPKYLYRHTSISKQVNAVLREMLKIDPKHRIKLPELRKLVEGTDSFFKRRASKSAVVASPPTPIMVPEEE
ncbi:kinase-like domain-containing protein [Pterulicium gracile]|uniref:Kinase-like domain-containing protein n=1 Tax=Pterulicium gracile TaxID=1884261 RepID=A0A5C3QIB7_9AGAR|nr:kinase-like domain-containing protein [Pterula gracilis]